MKRQDVESSLIEGKNNSVSTSNTTDPFRLPKAATHKISSAAILGGHTELQIDHNGEVYRLRKTRLGKLILTK